MSDTIAFAQVTQTEYTTVRLDFVVPEHTEPCTTYLMGNHILAEQMSCHDPAALLYAPLRVAIYRGHDRRTHLAVDRPSTTFGSFADPDIAAVGATLDERLVNLLGHLDVVDVAVDD